MTPPRKTTSRRRSAKKAPPKRRRAAQTAKTRRRPPSPRRISFWQKLKAKKRYILGAVAILVLCLGIWAQQTGKLAQSGFYAWKQIIEISAEAGWQLGTIELHGLVHSRAPDYLDALALTPGAPLLSISPQDIRDQLNTMNWVDSARVARHLPDRLVIHITEKQPFAVWQHQTSFAVITQNGDVIPDADAGQFSNLPHIVGSGANLKASVLWESLLAEPVVAAHVKTASYIGQRRWNLTLSRAPLQSHQIQSPGDQIPKTIDITVKLPDTDMPLAISRLRRLIETKKVLEKQLEVIDLRGEKVYFRQH